MRNTQRKGKRYPAPIATCKFGTVIESHNRGRGHKKNWPYGRFQIFVDGQLLTVINEDTLLEFGGCQPYISQEQLLAAVKKVYGVTPEIDVATDELLRASLLERATRQANMRRSEAHLRTLCSGMYAPEGYTQTELNDWRG